MKTIAFTCGAAALFLASALRAQAPAPLDPGTAGRSLLAARVAGTAPVLDGKLDDPVWETAAVARDFVQRRPQPGEPAKQQTEARVLYDGDAIYVGMRLYDSAPDSIAAQLARRDAGGIFSDWADVIIDSYYDRRTAYRFSVNPRGVLKDVYHYDDGSEDGSWNAVWEAKANVDAEGWTVEYRIPLSQLRFAPSADEHEEQVWGIQFGRMVARTEEQSFWAPVLPTTPGFVSLAGDLRGIRGLASPKRLELLPYTVTKITRAPEPAGAVRSPFWEATSGAASFGADLKYGVTSNLTLTGTINPDFGQVEGDPAVVNLSAYETFFGEQRPFFLEGSSLFSFGVGDGQEMLFYSRRVGRAPQRRSFAGADHTDLPEAATILGAAKLTGRTHGGWSIGVFDAVTQAEQARVLRDGEITDAAAEPLTNYAVARVSRDMRRGYSNIGAIFTATHRDLSDPAFAFLRSSAYSWGVNGRHRFGPGNNLNVQAFLAGSSIFGDTLAIQQAQLSSARYYQRPDADHVDYDPTRTALHGLAGEVRASKMGGRLYLTVGGRFRTPGFEVNDVGFLNNADQVLAFLSMNYNSYSPGKLFRQWNVGMNPSAGWDFGGTRGWTQVNAWGSGTFHNFWNVNFFANNRVSAWSTSALRGGPAIVSPGSQQVDLNVHSDRRRPLAVSAGTFRYAERGTGGGRQSVWAGLTVRPSGQLDFSLMPSLGTGQPAWQYVATAPVRNADGSTRPGEREYIFAGMEQTTFSMTTRLNYTVSPTLSLQFYAQPFVSAGDYTTFRRVADPRAADFGERFATFGEEMETLDEGRTYRAGLGDGRYVQFGNPDFNVRQLRTNAVLRWEYRPGSTLFLVWGSGRGGAGADGQFDFGRELDRLFTDAGTNVLQLKLNYWLNL